MPDSNPPKRSNFFDGKFLTAADFALEQNYVIEKSRRHNRSLHGFGVVTGLRVTITSEQAVVEPGLALDCVGNELVVASPQSISFKDLVDLRTAYLGLKYVEQFVDPVPQPSGAEEHANVVERVELSFSKENSNRGHRHARGRWLPCKKAHELTLAKLVAKPHGWRVDRRYRPPTVR
jgi:hypothetical protein